MTGQDDDMRFPQVFEDFTSVKTGQHAKTFLKQLNEAKKAFCEKEKVHRVCKALKQWQKGDVYFVPSGAGRLHSSISKDYGKPM